VPSRIESLSRIECIAAGDNRTSAAVDEDGKLFTWGRAINPYNKTMPSGLGYALDSETESQLTPKRVETLSEDRVVSVALGYAFTLVVTDAGAIFSFGYSDDGVLGHGSLEAEVLPRRIAALTQTGRRFVAVAVGDYHALALAEGSDLYGWGSGCTNGHGQDEPTPRQVAAFVGHRVELVCTSAESSCAVTEKGQLFTWGSNGPGQLGHGDGEPQQTPKWVEGLRGVEVVATAMCETHTRGRRGRRRVGIWRPLGCRPRRSGRGVPGSSMAAHSDPHSAHARPQVPSRAALTKYFAPRGDAVGHGCEGVFFETCLLSHTPRSGSIRTRGGEFSIGRQYRQAARLLLLLRSCVRVAPGGGVLPLARWPAMGLAVGGATVEGESLGCWREQGRRREAGTPG